MVPVCLQYPGQIKEWLWSEVQRIYLIWKDQLLLKARTLLSCRNDWHLLVTWFSKIPTEGEIQIFMQVSKFLKATNFHCKHYMNQIKYICEADMVHGLPFCSYSFTTNRFSCSLLMTLKQVQNNYQLNE